jgi:hypothetical protein
VALEGIQLRERRSYRDREGHEREAEEIIASDVQLLDSKGEATIDAAETSTTEDTRSKEVPF